MSPRTPLRSASDTFATRRRVMRRAAQYGTSIIRGAHLRYSVAYVLAHLVPPFTAGPLTARLYRAAGFRIGRGTSFGGPVRLISGRGFTENLDVGRDVFISTNVTINIDDMVRIEDDVGISPFVLIYTASHRTGPGSRRMSPESVTKPVTIGRGAWIRLGAMILPGVTVGQGSIVGAGSVVFADVPPHTYVEGNPAAVKRSLKDADR